MSNQDLIVCAIHMPQLQTLRLARCMNISSESVSSLASQCRLLSSLDLSCLPRGAITDDLLRSVAQHLSVREIDLSASDVSCEGLAILISSSPELQKLIITDCHRANGTVLQALAVRCPSLTELDARRVSEQVDSLDIEALCHGCTKLRRLALGGSRDTGSGIGVVGSMLTDGAVMSIGTLTQLEVLNLHSFQREEPLDEPLACMVQTCRQLQQLSLSNLELTDGFLCKTQLLRNLRMLRLAACVGVTFRGIYLFQQRCKRVEVRFREHRC